VSTFKAIIQLISVLITTIKWMQGTISLAQYNKRINKINTAIKKAQTGELPERLEGGKDVEDNFNRHA